MDNRFLHVLKDVLMDAHGEQMPLPLTDNLNKCIQHIDGLLASVVLLCKNRQYHHALFLAITAVEEAVKAEIYSHRTMNKGEYSKTSKDCLKRHDIKHKVAVNEEVLIIGKKVQQVIGEELTLSIYKSFSKGHTTKIRENCLYFDVLNATIQTPQDKISSKMTLAYILSCIEIIDDKLIGYTNYSLSMEDAFNEYFDIIKEIYNSTL